MLLQQAFATEVPGMMYGDNYSINPYQSDMQGILRYEILRIKKNTESEIKHTKDGSEDSIHMQNILDKINEKFTKLKE